MAIPSRMSGLGQRGRYDGPPGVVSIPYVRPGDGDAPSVCPGAAAVALRCGAAPNTQCPWSPFAKDDLCCVQDPTSSGQFEGKCAPCASADGNLRRTILFDGRWLLM